MSAAGALQQRPQVQLNGGDVEVHRFAQGLAALEAYVAARGHVRVPQAHRTDDGFALGTWVSNRRQDRKNNRLTAARVAALDARGFVW